MADADMIRALDLTIDNLIRRHATEEESEDAIRALYVEPRTWDTADISYKEST